jgi:uncharacterized protein YndB with AHSA1/START domain
VYAAWTDAQIASQWAWGKQHDNVETELDSKPGGYWKQTVRNRKDGTLWMFTGQYRELSPPNRVVFTFSWKSSTGHVEMPSLVEVTMAARDGGTDVTIVHSELLSDKVDGTTTGWNDCLDEITRALS